MPFGGVRARGLHIFDVKFILTPYVRFIGSHRYRPMSGTPWWIAYTRTPNLPYIRVLEVPYGCRLLL